MKITNVIYLNIWSVEENESPDNAVLREILEETGIKAKLIHNRKELSLKSEYCRQLATPFVVLHEDIEGKGTHNHIDFIYLCQAIYEDLLPQENEVDGIGWFTYDQIKELKLWEIHTAVLRDLGAWLKNN